MLTFLRFSIVGLASVVALGLTGCDNECSFTESRCNGEVVETCGDAADQMFHRRIHETPCDSLNSVCVESGKYAACVLAEKISCDDSFVPMCDRDVLLGCPSYGARYVVGYDCAADEMRCADETTDKPAGCVK